MWIGFNVNFEYNFWFTSFHKEEILIIFHKIITKDFYVIIAKFLFVWSFVMSSLLYLQRIIYYMYNGILTRL